MLKRIFTTVILLCCFAVKGQDISGIWQGVQKEDGSARYWPYSFALTQRGTVVGGYSRQVIENSTAFSEQQIEGTFSGNILRFDETKFLDFINPSGGRWCLSTGVVLVFDPIEEKLTGTYASDDCGSGGTFEMYRLSFKSPDVYCRGMAINLRVTGKDIRWYADISKNKLLKRGNEFSPNISETTTFYVTQTLYGTESPALPVVIRIVDMKATAQVANLQCPDNTGRITLGVSGNIGSLSYNIDNGAFQSSSVFEVKQTGSYLIKVKDSNGCELETKVEVGSDLPVINSVAGEGENCDNKDGWLRVEAFIATSNGPKRYSIDGVNFQSSEEFGGLTAGTYNVTVKDSKGCTAERSISLSKNLPPDPGSDITIVPESCDAKNGSVSINVAVGASVQFTLNNGVPQTSGTFSNLSAGNYTLACFIAVGCSSTIDIEVGKVEKPRISDIISTSEECGVPGSARIVASAQGRIEYAVGAGAFQEEGVFLNLSAGSYEVLVKDETGCVVSQTFEIDDTGVPPLDMENLAIVNPKCGEMDGRVDLRTRTVRTDLMYSIDDQNFSSVSGFSGLPEGVYQVTVKGIKSDQSVCWEEKHVVTLRENCMVHMPDVFTPDGDSKNEKFVLTAIDLPSYTLRNFLVYNRWGNVIFSQSNIRADLFEWDGRSGSDKVPAGEYPFRLTIENKHGEQISFTRSVLIVR